jgi:YVTN family beta-propeller protein
MKSIVAATIVFSSLVTAFAQSKAGGDVWPGPIDGGYLLPNGWRITPIGKSVPTEDLILNMVLSPDKKCVIATHGGYNTHGLVVLDAKTGNDIQRITLPTTWFGLAWNPSGRNLYVSGGNDRKGVPAPIYVFEYANGRLSDAPVSTMTDTVDPAQISWSGLAYHPRKNLLYAANRTAGCVAVFDTNTGGIVAKIDTDVNPYDLVFAPDGKTLYCSNWASDSVSVIDTEQNSVTATIAVGDNPNDMELAKDGRLFVCCSNDNTVYVIDTLKRRAVEIVQTSMYQNAPEGSTPNSLALDPKEKTLYVANMDNYNVCVINIGKAEEEEEEGEEERACTVLGFIPTGWCPTSVLVSSDNKRLFIGNAKGAGSYSDERGPHSTLPPGDKGNGSVKSLMKGTINIVDIPKNRSKLRSLTKQVYANCPYSNDLLAAALPPKSNDTIVPTVVGQGSPIKHVIYIIKENRTYDQVFGDMPQGNGEPRLAIFGREITPNLHAIAEQFVLLDNIYCDAEVSVDGHQWSNAAYATDFSEKTWPASYGGKSDAGPRSRAAIPNSGYLWDQCAKKGLTYRNYGEFAWRQSEKEPMQGIAGFGNLQGHVSPDYQSWAVRDYINIRDIFCRDMDEFDKNYDSPDPEKRLPNLIVMALPEDHTRGTRPGENTPRACVASNDYAMGLLIERVSRSKYWNETAIFAIEDDAQDGSDHVDARRTEAIVASAYCHRGRVDSTFYTTCSILRTIELLLGLSPMSQYDAAATPMYASFSSRADASTYTALKPTYDIEEMNLATAYGADESMKMDFSLYDRTPMFALNEIIWKSIKGADSEMPLPIHRFNMASLGDPNETR